MSTIKELLKIACLVALLTMLCTGAYISIKYGPESALAAKDTLVHADVFMGRGARAMGKIEVAADETAKASTRELEVVDNANTLITKVGGGVDGANLAISSTRQAAASTLVHMDGAINAVRSKVDEVDVKSAQQKADAVMDAVTGAIPHFSQAADNLAEDEDTFNTILSDPANAKLREAAIDFLASYASLGRTLNTTTGHIDKRFFAPYDGKHPKVHATIGTIEGLTGLGSRGAQGAYYGVGIARGQ